MKRVLVTGGAGFISSNFIRHILEATDHEVVTLDALTYAGNLENLADVMSHPRLSFVHGDIRNQALVRELVEGVDVIVNAAAASVHTRPSVTPIHCTGCGQNPATTCSASRIRRSGE